MKIKKGQIYIADLDGVTGSEQGGTRPVLVIQNNMGNKHSPTTIVACITTKLNNKAHLPTHCYLPNELGLEARSIVMLEQIRTIDKTRLHTYVGKLSSRYINIIDKKIAISLDLKRK